MAKFRWENLPRLRQVVAAMDLVQFFIDDSKGVGDDNVMDFSQDLTIEMVIGKYDEWLLTGCEPIRKLDGILDCLVMANVIENTMNSIH